MRFILSSECTVPSGTLHPALLSNVFLLARFSRSLAPESIRRLYVSSSGCLESEPYLFVFRTIRFSKASTLVIQAFRGLQGLLFACPLFPAITGLQALFYTRRPETAPILYHLIYLLSILFISFTTIYLFLSRLHTKPSDGMIILFFILTKEVYF